MAFIVDKETKKFWKAYGSGLTNEITGAFDYPENSAHCLLRLFPDEVYLLVERNGQMVEHTYTHDSKSSPLRTKVMRDKNLVWVAYQGLWMATDQQALVLGTLAANNTPSPYRPTPEAA